LKQPKFKSELHLFRVSRHHHRGQDKEVSVDGDGRFKRPEKDDFHIKYFQKAGSFLFL